jgi:hypothetical protein
VRSAHSLAVSRELSDASSQLQALECLEHRSAGGHTRRGLNGEVNLSRGVTAVGDFPLCFSTARGAAGLEDI